MDSFCYCYWSHAAMADTPAPEFDVDTPYCGPGLELELLLASIGGRRRLPALACPLPLPAPSSSRRAGRARCRGQRQPLGQRREIRVGGGFRQLLGRAAAAR
jgi:hypothetical protein